MASFKKTQFTVYILIGILIVLLTVGFFLKIKFLQKVQKGEVKRELEKASDARTDSVYLIKRCIIEETKNALRLAASQGGVINISKFKNNGKYIYWIYWNESIKPNSSQLYPRGENEKFYIYSFFVEQIPSLDYLREELSVYLKDRINNCLRNFNEVKQKYDVLINYKIKEVDVIFYNKSVKVVVDLPLTIVDLNNYEIYTNKQKFIEVIPIPYKHNFLKLKRLVEEIYSEGLYSYYFWFLQSLNNEIPITISDFMCESEGITLNKEEIKKRVEDLLKYGKNICYYDCKEKKYHPFQSFDKDLNVFFGEKELIKTQFLDIKYFDIFLNYKTENPLDRYRDEEGNIIDGNNIKIKAKTPEEYFGVDEVLFKSKRYICQAIFYYDVIFNLSLNYKDRGSKIPLSFNIMLDSGVLNNRPITLVFVKQYKNKEQPFVNESNNYKLWPRKTKILSFDLDEEYSLSSIGVDFSLGQIQQIASKITTKKIAAPDIYLDFSEMNNEKIPYYSTIFCYPFGVKEETGKKVPLAVFCGSGNIFIRNENYSGLIDIKKLKESHFFKDVNGAKIVDKNYIEVFEKNSFLDNLDKKINLTIINYPFNLEIEEIFKEEKLEEPNFWLEKEYINKSNTETISMLSLSSFNPSLEKIVVVNNLTKNVTIYTKKNIVYSDIFVKEYLYGSSFNYLDTNESKNQIFDKNYIKEKFLAKLENEDNALIIVNFYGNKVKFKESQENGLLINPTIYKNYLFVVNNEIINFSAEIFSKYEEIDEDKLVDLKDNVKDELEEIYLPVLDNIEDSKIRNKLEKELKDKINEVVEEGCYLSEVCIGLKVKEKINEIINNWAKDLIDNYGIILITRKEYLNSQEDLENKLKEIKLENIENNELNISGEKFNELMSNSLYFVRQKGLKSDIIPFFGREITTNYVINHNEMNLELLFGKFKGIIITQLNCSSEYQENVIFYLSDLGFKLDNLGLLNNLGENKYSIKQYIPLGTCESKTKIIVEKSKFNYGTCSPQNIVIDLSRDMCKKIEIPQTKIKGELTVIKEITYLDVIKEIVRTIYSKGCLNDLFVYNGNLVRININELENINCLDHNVEIETNNLILLAPNVVLFDRNDLDLERLKEKLFDILNGQETTEKIIREYPMIINENTNQISFYLDIDHGINLFIDH